MRHLDQRRLTGHRDLVRQRPDGKREIEGERLPDVDGDARHCLRLKALELGSHRVAARLQRLDREAARFIRYDRPYETSCFFGQCDGDARQDGPGLVDGTAIDLGDGALSGSGNDGQNERQQEPDGEDWNTHDGYSSVSPPSIYGSGHNDSSRASAGLRPSGLGSLWFTCARKPDPPGQAPGLKGSRDAWMRDHMAVACQLEGGF